MNSDIKLYNSSKGTADKAICDLLGQEIDKVLSQADSRIWHGHPVWFLNGNPVVGYAKRKNDIQLLFWSGQSFEESGLVNEGSFKAAGKRYTSVDEVNIDDLKRWLEKARKIQWDYKNIVRRKGQLLRIDLDK